MITSRSFWATVAACFVVSVGATPAVADDPLGDIPPAVLAEAAEVLDTAPARRGLEVVVTTRATTASRPDFETIAVDSRIDALETISEALEEPATAGVDMVQPAVIAGRAIDPLRTKQWGLDMVRWEADALRYSTGSGVKVAVVDTGVKIDHVDLKGRVMKGRDFVDPGTKATDQNGHGTHVAGAIAAAAGNGKYVTGVAPAATIVPVRVLNSRGSGGTDDVAAGIMWAADQRVNVINLSLTAPPTTDVEAAVAWALRQNIVVVAAAGNAGCPQVGSNLPTYPAAYPGVIGVGAVDRDGSPASFSSCGDWVDVMAPGVSITSLSVRDPKIAGCTSKRYWCSLSGTSMAAPMVSAAAALRIARTGRTGYDAWLVSDQILTAAQDMGDLGRDNRSGFGLIAMEPLLRAK
ncbi:MAG: S8 family serine peptidase [Aeromicrobium sp.]|uniref:S8 family serine peptidase n=1 Tax=Aeromicrobium sp. TaxID=1871063 RepID=UPI003C535964